MSRLSPAFEQCLKSYHTDLNRTTKNFAAVARDAHIDTGADINNAVIWSGARIGPAAVVRGAIIGRNCIINHTVPYIAVSAAYLRHDPALHAALAHLDWPHEQTAVIPLEPRGSARTFTRLTNGKHSVIMVNYSLERTENAYYARHIRLLKECGVETPRLLLEHPRRKLLLLEDIGGISLETLANRKSQPGELCNLYRETLDNLLRMHTAGTRMAHRRRHRMTAAFSPRLYKWEREFFAKHFLSQYTGCTAADTRAILAEIRISAVQLHNGPQCLIHRDMQSTNVLFRRAQPVFIDFQGMRFGPPAYDLASLLCDPYVELPEEIINASLEYYNNNAPRNLQVSAALFQHAAVERLAQALGAFGRLGANPATVRFKRFTPPALRRLALVLEQMDSYPVLTTIIHQTLAKHNI